MSRFKILSNDGSYLHPSFISKNIKWFLIGTESIQTEMKRFGVSDYEKYKNMLQSTYDTFKSEKGEYKTVLRWQIKELIESNKIEAIL